MLDLAVRGEQIDPVELALVARRNRYGIFGNAMLDQLGFDDIHRGFRAFGPRLCLIERDGPDRLVRFRRDTIKASALLQRVDDRRFPSGVLGKVDRQLDHLLRFELVGGGGNDDVRLQRRRGELDDGRGIEARARLFGQAGDEVVGLVHDHHGPHETHDIGEGPADFARALLCGGGIAHQPIRKHPALEERLKILVVFVDVALLRLRDAEGLDRCHDHVRHGGDVLRRDLAPLIDAENADGAAEGLFQRSAVGVTRRFKRAECLFGNLRGWHQPQANRVLRRVHAMFVRDPDRVRAEQRFAPTGRQAKAAIGHARQALQRLVC